MAKKEERIVFEPVCYSCVYYLGPYQDNQICQAFMDGIPGDIWSEGNNHEEVRKGQTEDLTYKVNSYG